MEGLRHNTALSAALTGITAAVVGVIANLAVFFAVNTLFDQVDRIETGPLDMQIPDLGTFDPLAATVAALAFLLLFRLRWSVLRTLGTCALIGAILDPMF